MKKRFTALVFLTLCLILIFFVCSCQNGQNEGTEVIYIDKDKKYNYCEHRWEMESQTLPTCVSEGVTVMKCRKCRKKNTTTTPKTECEYELSWDIYGPYHATVLFACKQSSAHNYLANAIVRGKDVVMASCQTPGKEIYDLVAYYKGKEYTNEYVVTKYYGGHKYITVTESLGDFCYDGVKTVEKCKSCGYVRSSSTRYDHLGKQEIARYDLSKLGYCDGTVIYKACACGCQNELLFENLTCKTTEKIDEYTVNGKNVYSRSIESCSNCALKIVTESAYYGENITPSGANIVFERTSVSLSDEISLETSITCSNHETTNHTFSYEFENLGEKCTDGVIVTKTCNECIYTIKYLTKGHTFQSETVQIGGDVCGLNVILERCHCGSIGECIGIENVSCTLVEIPASEHFTEAISFAPLAKAYKCTECGVSYYCGDVFEDFLDYISHIHTICSVKINGEVIFEAQSSRFEYTDEYEYFDRDLTYEELQAIENYFNSLKNQK